MKQGQWLRDKRARISSSGTRYKRTYEEEHLSQAKLAELLGIHNQTISKIERGIAGIPTPQLYAVIRTLKVPQDELVDLLCEDFKIKIEDEINRQREEFLGNA